MSAAPMRPAEPAAPSSGTLLLPVLPLADGCLLPDASLTLLLDRPPAIAAVQLAARTGGRLVTLALREPGGAPFHSIGTIAAVRGLSVPSPAQHQVELDGLCRARVGLLLGIDVHVAEAQPLPEGDAGDKWGAAVETLARYLHSHTELRSFLEERRRSQDVMSWVNLACQHLPITASARQKLLEADAAERCLKISRGLDALLRKEQA
jgi:Lon protease-like protein